MAGGYSAAHREEELPLGDDGIALSSVTSIEQWIGSSRRCAHCLRLTSSRVLGRAEAAEFCSIQQVGVRLPVVTVVVGSTP